MSKNWRMKALAPLGLLAVAWIGGDGIGESAHTQGLESKPAAGATIDEARCNPRDLLSPCFYAPPHGIPVGELLVVEDFF
jgi:hypothetical protein